MITSRVKITPAKPSDWGALLALRSVVEANHEEFRASHEKGMEQLRARFGRGKMWIARDEGWAVGAIGLDGPDTRFWDDNPGSPEALYIYKVMAVPGLGVGDQLLAFAETQARDSGLRLLRLYCLRGSHGLRAYWESKGFRNTRDVVEYDDGALFEKEIR